MKLSSRHFSRKRQKVCPSRSPIQGARARARVVVVGMDDIQTNGIKNLFHSSVRIEHRSEASERVGIDDGQTNGINFISFVCPSRTRSEASEQTTLTPTDHGMMARHHSNTVSGCCTWCSVQSFYFSQEYIHMPRVRYGYSPSRGSQ